MKNRLIELATGRPLAVYGIVIVLVLLLGSQIPRIHIDTDPENMLPPDQPDRVFHNEVEQRFSLHDALVVGVVNRTHPDGIYNTETLAKLHRLSTEILAMEGVIRPDLMSLSEVDNIRGTGGSIRFEWMMKQAPVTEAQSLSIRENVSRLPMLVNTLVSGDGRAAAIYVPISSKDLSYPMSLKIRAIMDSMPGTDEFHIAGLPVAEDTFGHEMFVQMGISAPLAGVMIFILMWWFFRNVRLIVAPMIVAMATVIATMGLLIGAGFTVHIMSSMIPIFLMPIAVVDSVHILSEFADRYDPEEGTEAVIRKVVGHLYRPMLFTSVTSAVGFASLLLTPIPPVQVFGAFVAFGILLAFILTIVFIPAYLMRMTPAQLSNLSRLKPGADADSLLARFVRRLGGFAFARVALIVVAMAAVLVASVLGVQKIEINDNPVRWFKSSHQVRIADRVLNEHFAGTYDAFLVLEHEDPTLTQSLQDRAAELKPKLAAYPDVVSALDRLTASPAAQDLDPLLLAVDDALFDAAVEDEAVLAELMQLTEQTQSSLRYFQQPDSVRLIDSLQKVMQDTGLVGKSTSLSDAVKVVNRELRSGEAADFVIPDTQPAVAQTLLQYQSSHRPHDLWHTVTPDYNSVAIWLQLRSGDNQDMSAVTEAVNQWLDQHPLPQGVTARWAGKTYINVVWQQAMVNGMFNSLLGAFAAVFIMMVLLFRSIRLGLLAMVPLLLTILGAYGLIGWMGKDYDMPIAVLSSLSLGLSIDFAIHFIQRLRELQQQCGNLREAISRVFEEPARAISRNAIVIGLGFTPLFFAPLIPYVTVGTFMVLIMLISAIATLVMLPALWRLVIGDNKAAS